MMIKAWRICKVALFPLLCIELVVELALNDIVCYDPLMEEVFTF